MDERGVHGDKPLRVGEGGPGLWQWQLEKPGGGLKKGKVVPPSDNGVKMFDTAQFNFFTPYDKKGAAQCFRFVWHCWEVMGLGGMHVARMTLE